MKKIFCFLIILLIFLSYFSLVRAASPSNVAINEIAWMGTINSANDEWLELYNNTGKPLNLDNWVLKADDGTPEIKLSGPISTNGFYLLERTDDNSVPAISADLIYKGALGNGGEDLKLYDNLNNLIDEVNCSGKWFTGNNTTKQTMERINPLMSGNEPSNWQASQNPNGTPKAQNSIILATDATKETRAPKETEKPNESTEVGSPQTYPEGIVLNELLPSPEGPDEQNEWIELFNQNNFEVELSGWQLSDKIGQTNNYTFPKETKISARGFLALPRPVTKITLNNSGDGLKLIQLDGKIVDEVDYEKAPMGKSYNLTQFGWEWSTILTPGSLNIIPPTTSPEPVGVPKVERENKAMTQTEGKKEEINKELAAVSAPFQRPQNKQSLKSLFVLFIALSLAIFSGTIILFLKIKLKGLIFNKK